MDPAGRKTSQGTFDPHGSGRCAPPPRGGGRHDEREAVSALRSDGYVEVRNGDSPERRRHTARGPHAAATATPPAPSPVDALVENALKALADYGSFTQEQVDHIVKKASVAALHEHV